MIFLIIILAIFFAINMGGASFAASFAAATGGKVLDKRKAGYLFVAFVILGAVCLGGNVSTTLGENIIPSEFIGHKALVLIFLTAGLAMFVANLMKIPQSTSLVTVAAIAGVGAPFGSVNIKTILFLLPFWIILPIASFGLTFLLAGLIYPPRKSNFWIYERFVNHQNKLKKFVIISSCYTAFSVGTNNVANVVGPILNLGIIDMLSALILFALFYGLGAFIFQQPLSTAGEKIVPLGLMTASMIYLVSGSLMIAASSLGVPQSFVMIQMGALFAVASLKHGPDLTFSSALTKKTFYTWTVNPVITFFVAFGFSWLIL